MAETMKAMVYRGIGDIGLEDVPIPKLQKKTDCIAKVTLSTICASDVHIVMGYVPYVETPRVLGHEFCAELLEVGEEVIGFKPGDRVHVKPFSYCGECEMCRQKNYGACENGGGFGILQDGCQAEYIRITNANSCMIHIPDELSDEDVLLLGDMLGTAWFGIKNTDMKKGDTAAVVGVGPVGQCTCLMLKKAFGAEKVIALDLVKERAELAVSSGAADVGIHVTDPVKAVREVHSVCAGGLPRIVIEAGTTEESFDLACRLTALDGWMSTVSVFGAPVNFNIHKFLYRNMRFATGIQRTEGMTEMLELIKSGIIDTGFVLTHRGPLNDIAKGYDLFGNKKDGCVKWVVTPYER